MIPGVDCSHWHPVVDWGALQGAVRFMGAKATEGAGNTDPTFAVHRDGFRASTLDLGIWYHLGRVGDAKAQARRFMAVVGDLGPHERVCLDVERTSGVDLAFLEAFFGELLGNGHAPLIASRPLIYVSAGGWRDNIGAATWWLAEHVDLWIPRYGPEPGPLPAPWMPDPENPQPWQCAKIWQHSDQANIPGVGVCDGNFFLGTQAELTAFAA